MQVINYSDFRKNMKVCLDNVNLNADVTILNRGKDNNTVLISLKEYNALLETIHLTSSQKNVERLMSAIERDNVGEFEKHDLVDVQ